MSSFFNQLVYKDLVNEKHSRQDKFDCAYDKYFNTEENYSNMCIITVLEELTFCDDIELGVASAKLQFDISNVSIAILYYKFLYII